MQRASSVDFSDVRNVFLDRDGVLNRKPPEGQYVTSWEEFDLLPGVERAIGALNRSGRKVIVVTNQRGVAKGLYSFADLERMHGLLRARLAQHDAHLDAIYVCPHEEGECSCRKPGIGLFEQAFRDFPDVTPARSLMVGDSIRDIEAGARAGMRTVLVWGNADHSSAEVARAAKLAQLCVGSLAELVTRYLCPNQSAGG